MVWLVRVLIEFLKLKVNQLRRVGAGSIIPAKWNNYDV